MTSPLRHTSPSAGVPLGWGYKCAGRYRYGFNGKESDDEVSVGDGSYDFGARMYDARFGRWWSVDGKFKECSYESPYILSSNIPTVFVDPDGLKKRHFIVVNNHITGTSTTIELPSSDDLQKEMIAVRQYVFGLPTNSWHYEYAWYDFTQTITFDIYSDHIQYKSGGSRNDNIRTTTYADSEWWANVKIGEHDKLWGGICWTTSGYVGAGNGKDKSGRYKV
jgi:RHS repeat-associated protein